MTLVFVYGTLKKGHRLSSVLSNSEPLGEARTAWPNYDLKSAGAFPYLVAGEHYVLGEVYRVDQPTLARLDRIEGVPHLYTRSFLPVETRDGIGHEADAYFWARNDEREDNNQDIEHDQQHNWKQWVGG